MLSLLWSYFFLRLLRKHTTAHSPSYTVAHRQNSSSSLKVLAWWLFMRGRWGWAISGQLINHTGCRPLISSTGTEESFAAAPHCISNFPFLSISLFSLFHPPTHFLSDPLFASLAISLCLCALQERLSPTRYLSAFLTARLFPALLLEVPPCLAVS